MIPVSEETLVLLELEYLLLLLMILPLDADVVPDPVVDLDPEIAVATMGLPVAVETTVWGNMAEEP